MDTFVTVGLLSLPVVVLGVVIYRSESERRRRKREAEAIEERRIAQRRAEMEALYPDWDQLEWFQQLELVADDPDFARGFDEHMRRLYDRRWQRGIERYNSLFTRYWKIVDVLPFRLSILAIVLGVALYLLPLIILGSAVYGAVGWLSSVSIVALGVGGLLLAEVLFMTWRWASVLPEPST